MYNIIFLDFDGVLNSRHTKEKFKGWAGIEDEKVALLKELVESTKSIIVLTTSWRHSWDYASYKDTESSTGRYISDKFAKQGLRIRSKTESLGSRGKEIHEWLERHPHGKWVVLDDEKWDDFETYGIWPHLVETDYDKGLSAGDISKAKKILQVLC